MMWSLPLTRGVEVFVKGIDSPVQSPIHTRSLRDGSQCVGFPGTTCQATIKRSLRDRKHHERPISLPQRPGDLITKLTNLR
jgi:hypothetical protein